MEHVGSQLTTTVHTCVHAIMVTMDIIVMNWMPARSHSYVCLVVPATMSSQGLTIPALVVTAWMDIRVSVPLKLQNHSSHG